MKIEDKLSKAIEMVCMEEDGSTYLQSKCSMKELKQALSNAQNDFSADVIRDAITIKRFKNSSKVTQNV